jgi:hypothetical protein
MSATPVDRYEFTATPVGKRPNIRVVVDAKYKPRGQCSWCRGQLHDQTVIHLSKFSIHRWCIQWLLERSHEHIPDVDPFVLKKKREIELQQETERFIEESRQRIAEREAARRREA